MKCAVFQLSLQKGCCTSHSSGRNTSQQLPHQWTSALIQQNHSQVFSFYYVTTDIANNTLSYCQIFVQCQPDLHGPKGVQGSQENSGCDSIQPQGTILIQLYRENNCIQGIQMLSESLVLSPAQTQMSKNTTAADNESQSFPVIPIRFFSLSDLLCEDQDQSQETYKESEFEENVKKKHFLKVQQLKSNYTRSH